MTAQEMQLEIARLQAENATLKTAGKITLRVSDKGALSVYGMGRFPVTLYREQWERLFGAAGDIKAFIAANSTALKLKETK